MLQCQLTCVDVILVSFLKAYNYSVCLIVTMLNCCPPQQTHLCKFSFECVILLFYSSRTRRSIISYYAAPLWPRIWIQQLFQLFCFYQCLPLGVILHFLCKFHLLSVINCVFILFVSFEELYCIIYI